MISEWRKSSRSSSQGNADCVEARSNEERFEVRDSKLGDASPIFEFEVEDFLSLLRAAR
ncbi:DUF397 domain-containing protein [Glycomyces sp. NPDC021274]|uniref:DUF397 domain-containing protein n=1 Tax=Glycomyces sp. NPDC021274 TaxID=3155120 RepID=UPI0033C8251D